RDTRPGGRRLMPAQAGGGEGPAELSEGDDDGWMQVLPAAEWREGSRVAIDLGGLEVMLSRTGDRLYAIGDRCTHAGTPLHRGMIGTLSGEPTVTCPLHGSLFRLSDGRVLRGPAVRPEPAFDVRQRRGPI